MFKDNEKVFVFRASQPQAGVVIGSDSDLFWVLVSDLNKVFRGHLSNVFELKGEKYLSAEEWSHDLKDMFDAEGQFVSEAFRLSQNPKPMIDYLKMHRLIYPHFNR